GRILCPLLRRADRRAIMTTGRAHAGAQAVETARRWVTSASGHINKVITMTVSTPDTAGQSAPPEAETKYLTFDPAEIDRREVYRLLTGSVVPRPIGWASTVSA